jgi:hypothetical protein
VNDQVFEQGEGFASILVENSGGSRQRPATNEHAEASKGGLIRCAKTVIAPGDGVAHGLLAEWPVPGSASE